MLYQCSDWQYRLCFCACRGLNIFVQGYILELSLPMQLEGEGAKEAWSREGVAERRQPMLMLI